MTLAFQPVSLANGDDDEGMLVFLDDKLVAVLARLSAQHDGKAGQWFLECGFGPLSRCDTELRGG
jgi:hypothetical protein